MLALSRRTIYIIRGEAEKLLNSQQEIWKVNMSDKNRMDRRTAQSASYPKSRVALLKFLIVCLPFWFSTKFYNGPNEDLVRNYLAGILLVITWGVIVQLIRPKLNERVLLIAILLVFTALELACWQIPGLFSQVSVTMFDRTIIGSPCSLHKIPYYGVGAFIGFFILKACRIR